MRTAEEIRADIKIATSIFDATALQSLAQEMMTIGTAKSEVEALNALGLAHGALGNYDVALEHYRRAQTLLEDLGDRTATANVLCNMGIVYRHTGDYESSLEHYRRALAIDEEVGDREGAAFGIGNMGLIYRSMGDYPSALEHYRRALAIHEEFGDRNSMARVIGNIGVVSYDTGNFAAAIEQYQRALVIHEELENPYGAANVVANIGNVYLNTGDNRSALAYYQRAVSLFEALGDTASVADATGNVGSAYHNLKEYQSALEYYRRALILKEEMGNLSGVAHESVNIVSTLLASEQYEEAAELLGRQSDLQMDSPTVRAIHFDNLAVLAEHNQDLDGARDHLLQALDIVSDAGVRIYVAVFHERLRDLARKRNDFDGYVDHNIEYQRVSEEVRGKEATQKMAMMEAEQKMEGERREREKERAILYSTLPSHVADRLVRGEDVSGDHFDHASVMFLDIVGFTTNSHDLEPRAVTELLDDVFHAFDELCATHYVTKIKTIGDAYLAVAFPHDDQSTEENIASVALGIQQLQFTWPNASPLQFRIGLHSGPIVAGVIGKQRLQYDVWGDTVNTTSRMESSGEPGRIHVSSSFAIALSLRHQDPRLQELRQGEVAVIPSDSEEQSVISPFPVPRSLIPRGEIEIKGKGRMTTYWLENAS